MNDQMERHTHREGSCVQTGTEFINRSSQTSLTGVLTQSNELKRPIHSSRREVIHTYNATGRVASLACHDVKCARQTEGFRATVEINQGKITVPTNLSVKS